MAKRGKKLTDELKEEIRANLVLGDNKNDIAKRLDVSWSTVQKIAKEIEDNPEENKKFEKLREVKKEELINMMWDNIVEAQELGFQMIKEAKQGMRDIPLGQISTYLGTIYDKRALMNNESTANTSTKIMIEGYESEWSK